MACAIGWRGWIGSWKKSKTPSSFSRAERWVGPEPRAGSEDPAPWRLFRGRGRLLGRLLGSRRGFPALRGLRAEPLGEPLDAAFGIDQFLAAGEERMAVIADFEVQLRLRGPRLPRRAARAPDLDLVVLGVNPFLHGLLLGTFGKRKV